MTFCQAVAVNDLAKSLKWLFPVFWDKPKRGPEGGDETRLNKSVQVAMASGGVSPPWFYNLRHAGLGSGSRMTIFCQTISFVREQTKKQRSTARFAGSLEFQTYLKAVRGRIVFWFKESKYRRRVSVGFRQCINSSL